MSMNQHSKQCLSDSLRFREKRVEFKPWLQQIVAKLNVNMLNNNASVQFWYLYSWLEELALSQVTPWIVTCIKSSKVLNCTIIEKLINQLQHVYNNSESKKKVTHTLKTLKQMRKPFAKHLTTLNKRCWKQKAWNEMMLSRKHFLITVLTQHLCELWLSPQFLCCMMSTLSCYSESVTT